MVPVWNAVYRWPKQQLLHVEIDTVIRQVGPSCYQLVSRRAVDVRDETEPPQLWNSRYKDVRWRWLKHGENERAAVASQQAEVVAGYKKRRVDLVLVSEASREVR